MSIDAGTYKRALLLLAGALIALAALTPPAWAAPANDDFSAAQTLSPGLPREFSESNQEATKEVGEPAHAGNVGGHSVWFSWTPAVSGPVAINTGCFLSFEMLTAVYTGSAVNSLTPVASNQGFSAPSCFGESSKVEFTAEAGTTYWIAIDGRDGAQGSFSATIEGAPANDDFADAAAIGGESTQQAFGTTKFATTETGEPDHAGEPVSHSVWFSWTPAVSGPVAISTCSSFYNLDTVLAVYTGSAIGALTPVAANDDAPAPEWSPACAGANSEVLFEATAGTTYRIAVDSTGETAGRFTLRLRGRPANDDFANALALSPNLPANATPPQTLQLATKQAGEPDHAGEAGGHSVWFSWTPVISGPVAVSTCGAETPLDTLLAVYTGASVGALTPVQASDNARPSSCGRVGSEAQFDAVAGTTYRIAIDGKGGEEGRFYLNLEGGPANDDFAKAQGLGSTPTVSASGNTKLATEQSGEPDHAGELAGHSVWFSWTAPASGRAVISTCPYNEQGAVPVLAVYTGPSVDALTPVAADAAGGAACSPSGSELELSTIAGTTYRIAVDGKEGAVGIFSLEIESRPENDDFATPQVLSPTPMMAGGTTRLASRQAGEPNHAGDSGGHSLWFSWTPASSGPVDVVACGDNSEIDTLLGVYTGGGLGVLTSVAANDDAPPPPAYGFCDSSRGASEARFDVTAGTTYRIAVDGKGGSTGHFTLAFEPAPANDDFASPQILSAGLPAFGSSVTALASRQAAEPDHAGEAGGHSVWFSWTPSSSGQVAISTCTHSGDLDALLAVYTGSALDGLTPVAASDDDASGRCRAADGGAGFLATAGTNYRIAVDGKADSTGLFQLILEGATANDDFGKALSLGGALPTANFGSNRFATKQAGEPDHAGSAGGASVWFKWTAPRSGTVSVDTCGSNFDTLLAIYTGASVAGLTPVQSNDDGGGKCSPHSKLSFEAVANSVYRVAVDGKAGAQGSIELKLDVAPGNDDFAAAEKVPGSLGWYWPGSTLLATKQAGEPDHAGEAGGHTVWFSWTPAKSVAVELDACTTSFDPLLGIYTGDAVGGLTAVGTTDAGSGECEDEGRSIGLDATAGTTYRIAVDGAGGDAGHFELHLRPAVAHPRSLEISSAGGGSGSVVSTGADVACASLCSYHFEVGESVALAAHPAAGSAFAGWSGGGCSGTGTCEVTLNADTAVVANFTPPAAGGGGGGPVPPAPSPAPTPTPPVPGPKPLHCKPKFKKVRVHGKAKCVKKGGKKGGRRGSGR